MREIRVIRGLSAGNRLPTEDGEPDSGPPDLGYHYPR
jgi:hypothetical protein